MEANTQRPTRSLRRLVALVALASMLQGCMTMQVGNPTALTDGRSRTVRITLADQSRLTLHSATIANDSVVGYTHVLRENTHRSGVALSEVQGFEFERLDADKTTTAVVVASSALVLLVGIFVASVVKSAKEALGSL
jgi:hypothetical protein